MSFFLFLDAQSTDQDMLGREAKRGGDTHLALCAVLRNSPTKRKGQNLIFNHTLLKKQTLNIKYLLYNYSVYFLWCLSQGKKISSVWRR